MYEPSNEFDDLSLCIVPGYCATEECSNHTYWGLRHCPECLRDRLLVVLDLDSTLIHSQPFLAYVPCDAELPGPVYLFMRPHLKCFLKHLFARYRVGFWSAGSRPYVEDVLKVILEDDQVPEFVFTRTETLFAGTDRIKPLRYICPDITNVFLVDDHPPAFLHNPGHGVLISPFDCPETQQDDKELVRVTTVIDDIAAEYLALLRNIAELYV